MVWTGVSGTVGAYEAAVVWADAKLKTKKQIQVICGHISKTTDERITLKTSCTLFKEDIFWMNFNQELLEGWITKYTNFFTEIDDNHQINN